MVAQRDPVVAESLAPENRGASPPTFWGAQGMAVVVGLIPFIAMFLGMLFADVGS